MKIVQCSIERNFHVSNDDRFLLEKASLVAQIEDNENEQDVINSLREKLATNFKNAYPKIEMSINFEYAANKFDKEWNAPPQKVKVNGTVYDSPYLSNINDEPPQWAEPKIKSGTIEEQILQCNTLEELKDFEYIRGMNKKYQTVYDEKMSSLTIK